MLVIAGGQSVTDYDGLHLANLARLSFTFAVNYSAKLWPCDVVVALDPDFLVKNKEGLKSLEKPIITRKWAVNESLGLDLIELPNDIPWRLSGQVACYLADRLAKQVERKVYVLGMDATAGHYYNDESDCSKIVTMDDYERMGLKNTVNLGVHSRIKAWPKMSKLPSVKKVLVTPAWRAIAVAWLRANAAKEITG